jgi:hypothetical protein
MAEYELNCVNNIDRFLSGFHSTSTAFAGTLGRLRLRWQDMSLNARLAPAAPGGAITEPGCLISIGSPAYNSVSAWIEERFPELAVFAADGSKMEIAGLGSSVSGLDFIVERAVVPDSDICAFYCAGLSVFGTEAAVSYLLSHWRKLNKQYKTAVNFALIGECDGVSGLFKEIKFAKSA